MIRRRWPLFLSLLLMATSLFAPDAAAGPAATAAPKHWAADAVDKLTAQLGWTAPPDLDTPVPVLEWNRLVARMAGEASGDADPTAQPRQYWVWTYTGGMARNTFVLRREDAIGGLMKLASWLYQEKGFAAEPASLDPFADGAKVADYQRALVAGAIRLGVVNGYPGGALNPTRPLTYAEGATLVARMLDRYGKGGPFPEAGPDPEAKWPQPRGFATGTDLRLPAEQVIHAGWPVGTVGSAWWVIDGAAYAAELPGVGAAPDGQVWVVVDTELYNWDLPSMTIASDALRFTLTDESGTYALHQEASTALGSTFGQASVVLKQRESLRGFILFAVPAGARALMLQCDSKLGLAPEKSGYNGSSVVPLGDLP